MNEVEHEIVINSTLKLDNGKTLSKRNIITTACIMHGKITPKEYLIFVMVTNKHALLEFAEHMGGR